jgi:hypothetical protein
MPFQDTVAFIFGMIFLSTFLGYLFYAKGLATVQAKHATVVETLANSRRGRTAVYFPWWFPYNSCKPCSSPRPY